MKKPQNATINKRGKKEIYTRKEHLSIMRATKSRMKKKADALLNESEERRRMLFVTAQENRRDAEKIAQALNPALFKTPRTTGVLLKIITEEIVTLLEQRDEAVKLIDSEREKSGEIIDILNRNLKASGNILNEKLNATNEYHNSKSIIQFIRDRASWRRTQKEKVDEITESGAHLYTAHSSSKPNPEAAKIEVHIVDEAGKDVAALTPNERNEIVTGIMRSRAMTFLGMRNHELREIQK